MGIRGQLALFVPGVVALSLMGLALVAAQQDRREQTLDMRARREQVLQAVGITAAVYVAQNDMAGLDTLIAHLVLQSSDPDLLELAVLDAEGRVLAHSDPTQFNVLKSDPFSQRAIRSAKPQWLREGETLLVAVPAISGIRWATLVARYSLQRLDSAIARARTRWIAGALALGAVLGVMLFIGLDRWVVRPVRSLQVITRKMGEGQLDLRVPPLKGRELGELADTVNKMASALSLERKNLELTVEERTRELREANQTLEKLAVTDGLTGVFNHRRFQEALAQEILRSERSDRPMSVLMIDVDHFKRFNDTRGHPAGDDLLRDLAATLGTELRATDVLSRYGGEEFAIVLPETPKDQGIQVGDRIRRAVEEGGLVTISVGVATFPEDGRGPYDLIAAADRALYSAKRRGRNQVAVAGVEPT